MLNAKFNLAPGSASPSAPASVNKSPASESDVFKFTPKQAEFISAVFSGEYNYLLFGGGIRGGKSYGLIGALLILAKVFPSSRWAVVRTDRPTLIRTTLVTYRKMVPPGFEVDFNWTQLTATFKNGSQLIFFPESFSEDPELNRWRGLEVNGFGLEEGNELRRATFDKAIERAGSWILPNSSQPHPLVLITCNPGQGYLKELFYDPYVAGTLSAPWYYLPALLTDNPHIPPAYVESLKAMDPGAYRRFVLGSWDAADDVNQLIPWDTVYACEAFKPPPSPPEPLGPSPLPEERRAFLKAQEAFLDAMGAYTRITGGADVGRFGPDPTVIKLLRGGNLYKEYSFPKTDMVQVADKIAELIASENIEPEDFAIDGTGIGAGVIDILRNRGLRVFEYTGGSKAITERSRSVFKFKNLRAQSFWYLKLALQRGELGNMHGERLKQDLTAIRYKIVGDRMIQLESKDEIRERINRSPDDADALCMANWSRVRKAIQMEAGIAII